MSSISNEVREPVRCFCGLGGYEGHDPKEEPCNGHGYERGSRMSVSGSRMSVSDGAEP